MYKCPNHDYKNQHYDICPLCFDETGSIVELVEMPSGEEFAKKMEENITVAKLFELVESIPKNKRIDAETFNLINSLIENLKT